jgi:[ribosomal protein S5]-alanine N-acetyltransferase
MKLPPLETPRLLIRPYTLADLEDVHRLLDQELSSAATGADRAESLDARRSWLEWTVLSYEELARLHQPPYGDRAVVLRGTGELVGQAGFVPCLNVFGQLPSLAPAGEEGEGLYSTEFGLFWAVRPAFRNQGIASEAAAALVGFAFETLRLSRVVATTTYGNAASRRVMEKLGMRIETNPRPDPPWLQVVGILENRPAANSLPKREGGNP